MTLALQPAAHNHCPHDACLHLAHPQHLMLNLHPYTAFTSSRLLPPASHTPSSSPCPPHSSSALPSPWLPHGHAPVLVTTWATAALPHGRPPGAPSCAMPTQPPSPIAFSHLAHYLSPIPSPLCPTPKRGAWPGPRVCREPEWTMTQHKCLGCPHTVPCDWCFKWTNWIWRAWDNLNECR